jgi:hypothetical protein
MSEEYSESLAYILIVESDEALRHPIPRSISVPNCAVDVARDEDEAVHKALQHRPRLIIVKRHDPIEIDPMNPPIFSGASRICRRARLPRSVRLVTHSDVSVMGPATKAYLKNSNGKLREVADSFATEESPAILTPRFFLLRPMYKDQNWRKEWFLYCSPAKTIEVLSQLIPFWLGRTSDPLSSSITPVEISFYLRNKFRSNDGYTIRYLTV